MANLVKADMSAVVQRAIDSIVQRELQREAILLPTITDYSALLRQGNNGVLVPTATSFAMADKAPGAPTVTTKLTVDTDDIPLNKYKHVVARIEDQVQQHSKVTIDPLYIGRMATALGRQMDDDILVSINDVDAGNEIDNEAGVITKTKILEARKLLKENEARGERILGINPENEAAMLAITGFVDASQYGSNQPVLNGELGRVYGCRIVVSNLFPDLEWAMWTKEHVGWIRSMSPKFEKQRAELQHLAYDLSLSHEYGSGVLQGGVLGVRAYDVTP